MSCGHVVFIIVNLQVYYVSFSVLIMPSERYDSTVELFTRTINNLFTILAPVTETTKRHVDDNRLTLTKEQSHMRLIYLLIVSSACLSVLISYLICLLSYSGNTRQGIYFHENINEKEDPMRKQKLLLIHIDGTTKKLGLQSMFTFFVQI